MNALLLCEMAGKPYWWFILFLVPIVNIVISFVVWYNVALRAGHPGFWGILAALPVVNIIAWFYMAFASGSSQYQRVTPSYSEQDQQKQQTPTHFNQ